MADLIGTYLAILGLVFVTALVVGTVALVGMVVKGILDD